MTWLTPNGTTWRVEYFTGRWQLSRGPSIGAGYGSQTDPIAGRSGGGINTPQRAIFMRGGAERGDMAKVRWHVITSVDGFIAAPGDDMRWIFEVFGESATVDRVIATTGAIL